MKIEFDTTDPRETTAIRALLDVLHPTAKVCAVGDSGPGIVVPTGDSETDKTGAPHDPRIHSTPAKLNADGTWRAKRGVSAELVEQVKAELVEQVKAELVEQVEETVEEHIAEVATLPEPSAPPAPPPPAAPTPPAPSAEPSFLDIMKLVTPAQKDGKLTAEQVKEMCEAVGAEKGIMGLNGPDAGDKRAAFMAMLKEVLG